MAANRYGRYAGASGLGFAYINQTAGKMTGRQELK